MTQVSDWLAHLDRVSHYGQKVLEQGCKENFSQTDLSTPLALSLLLRTLEHVRAIKCLMVENCLVEARAICRCCLENCFVSAAIANKGEDFIARVLGAEFSSIRKTIGELQSHREQVSDFGLEFEDQLEEIVGVAEDYHALKGNINFKEFAKGGNIENLYINYRMLSQDSAHPTISSLRRHYNIVEQQDGSFKVMLSEEPEFSERERCATLDTAALALLGVAVSARSVRGISGLVPEIEHIRDLWPRMP